MGGAVAGAVLGGSVAASVTAVATGASTFVSTIAASGIGAGLAYLGSNLQHAGQDVVQVISSVGRGGNFSTTATNSAATTPAANAVSGTAAPNINSTALSTQLAYPLNGGFAGTPSKVTSYVGEVWQRIGSHYGQYVSAPGATPQSISLEFGKWGEPMHFYKTIVEFDYLGGIAAPFYGLPGGGYQAYVDVSVKWLLDNGYLIELF